MSFMGYGVPVCYVTHTFSYMGCELHDLDVMLIVIWLYEPPLSFHVIVLI